MFWLFGIELNVLMFGIMNNENYVVFEDCIDLFMVLSVWLGWLKYRIFKGRMEDLYF